MADLACPRCKAMLASEDVNIAEGVAFCRACGSMVRLREIVDAPKLDGIDPVRPPRRCRFHTDGVRAVLSARCGLNAGLGMAGSALFWNSIVLIFVLEAIASTLHLIYGGVPVWFPSPANAGGSFWGSGGPTVGNTVFAWIFLLPFIGVGHVLGGAAILALFGRVEVRIDQDEGCVFTGVGPIGWRRRFDPAAVQSVRIGIAPWTVNEQDRPLVVLSADQLIWFGAMLPEPSQLWLIAVLRKILVLR